jgi:hypothetical protein
MPASNLGYRIADFGQSRSGETQAADSRALAQLHCTLLPDSSLPKLGRGFLEHFYYSVLPQEGLLIGCVAYVDGIPAGFSVHTPYPGTYMGLAIRRHPVRFAWRMALAALTHPGNVIPAWRARKRMAAQASFAGSGPADAPRRFLEGLFLGVMPEYSRPRFIRETGIHVGRDLVLRGLSLAQGHGAPEMRTGVMRTNAAVLTTLLQVGWKVEERARFLVTSDDHLELRYDLAELPRMLPVQR